MAADLKLAGFQPGTQQVYLRLAERLAEFHMLPPGQMGTEQVRSFLIYLVEERKLAPSTQVVAISALRFLFTKTLMRPEVMAPFSLPKVPHRVPEILSGSEILRLFDAVYPLKCRTLLRTAYGAGLRISEACSLEFGDIDRQRMVIHVRKSKGGGSRYVMLSPRVLRGLETYWQRMHPPGPLFFPGRTLGRPISKNAVRTAIRRASVEAGITKRVTPHTLRHTFATHLLEAGTDIRTIQAMLGHKSIRSTQRYVQVSRRHVSSTKSPLDMLGTEEGKVLG